MWAAQKPHGPWDEPRHVYGLSAPDPRAKRLTVMTTVRVNELT